MLLFKANITIFNGEDTPVNLTCPDPTRLTIVHAFYGVPSCDNCTCNYCSCPNATAMLVISDLCNGLTSCSFTAGNELFGDPCRQQIKTFELAYFCN